MSPRFRDTQLLCALEVRGSDLMALGSVGRQMGGAVMDVS
jgi:hypothetical protein